MLRSSDQLQATNLDDRMFPRLHPTFCTGEDVVVFVQGQGEIGHGRCSGRAACTASLKALATSRKVTIRVIACPGHSWKPKRS